MNADTPSFDVVPDGPGLAAQMRPALVKYFRRKTGDAVEAEDLAQDVLMRALTHARWKSPEQAKGYIFRSAVNRWQDRRRRLQTQGATVAWNEDAQAGTDCENPSERALIVQEELNQIAQGIDELNVRTRTVLMLIKFEQMKPSTVAEMLGISVRAVNKHLAKAITHLGRVRAREEYMP